MLEILILIRLGQTIARKAREKGRSGTPYVLLLLAFWFGGEILGAIAAAFLTSEGPDAEPNMIAIWLAGMVCAAIGATIAFLIVGALPPINEELEGDYDDESNHSR